MASRGRSVAARTGKKAATKRPRGLSTAPPPPRAADARPSQRPESLALRGRIIGKAAGVFGRLGAADTTVEDILEAADVSRRTFYRFFQNKEDVLDALHEIGCNQLVAAARQAALTPVDPLARLSGMVERYLDYHVTVGSNVMSVVQGESMRAGSPLGPRRRVFLDAMVEILGSEIERVSGLRVEPLLLRSLLVALEAVSLMMHADANGGPPEIERAKRVMLRIVTASLAGEGENVPPLPLVPSPAETAEPTPRVSRRVAP